MKRVNRGLDICVIKFPKRGGGIWCRKTFKEIEAKTFPKFGKIHKSMDSRSSVNFKLDKLKEIHTQSHKHQIAED